MVNNTKALPWEVWQETKSMAQLNSGTQSLLRSSYCPYNCRFDRTSSGDTRFLRMEGDEAVIFEELNPGAISRIWMTSGIMGASVDLDANVRIKFYFNGEPMPRIDVPLPQLFDNSVSPFVSPLVANRLISSGGNISYVPIAYSDSLKISLTNATDYKLWYQFNFHRLTQEHEIETFDFQQSFSELSELLNQTGDIWQTSESIQSDTTTLAANQVTNLYESEQAGWIKSLKIDIDENYYDDVELILSFDDHIHSQLKLSEFFAIGGQFGVTTQSLFVGLNDEGSLYSNFPMPYFKNMKIDLLLNNDNLNDTSVLFEMGLDHQTPNNGVGLFTSQRNNTCPSAPFLDTVVLNSQSRGKWIGLYTENSSVNSLSKQYLEGDERVYIDGDIHPTHYGTGVEDFYNGGFYYDQGDFSSPLHGAPFSYYASASQSITASYRFMLTDGIDFQQSILAQVENGPFGDLEMCTKSIAYFYSAATHFQSIDILDLNSEISISDHNYTTSEAEKCESLLATFLDEPATQLESQSCKINSGEITFDFIPNQLARNFRMKRLFDNSYPDQVADIYVNDVYQGRFSYVPEKPASYIPSNPDRKWQQDSIDFTIDNNNQIQVRIVPRFDTGNFTAAKYELLAEVLPDVIFADSFD